MKNIYVIRHCEANGQFPEAKLTNNGLTQAEDLSAFFSNIQIDRIISSPYKRALDSITPLAKQLNVDIEIDIRLKERVLSTENLSDWFEKLGSTFDDIDLKFQGGESSKEAMLRVSEVVEEVCRNKVKNTIIVTHGNLIALLLKYYMKDFGFEEWQNLSNPDVFLLKNEDNKICYERLWDKRIQA